MISKEEVLKLAYLAHLEFSEEELDGIIKDMDEIIAFADKVNGNVEGDTENILNVSSFSAPSSDFREDAVMASLPREKILSNTNPSNGMFTVKRGI